MDNFEGYTQLGFSFAVSGFLLVAYRATMEKMTEKLEQVSIKMAEIAATLNTISERIK